MNLWVCHPGGRSPRTRHAPYKPYNPCKQQSVNMPILAAEPDVFPTDLLSQDILSFNEECDESRWWAVYTRSRQEKQLMRQLFALEIPYYCPIIPNRFRSPSGRMRTSYLPLFANYLFLFGDVLERYRALQTNLIVNMIEVKDGLELTRDLRQIQRLIQLGSPIRVESQYQPGTRIRIMAGPLSGIEGVVVKRQNADFLFVAVNFLQQGALVRLEGNEIESLS